MDFANSDKLLRKSELSVQLCLMEIHKVRDYGEQEVDDIKIFQNILLGMALQTKNNSRYIND